MSEDRYIVMLPTEGVGVDGYEGTPKIAESHAASPAQAVTQYLHRRGVPLSTRNARIVAGILSKRAGGLEAFAVLVPEVTDEDGRALYGPEREQATQNELAQELARQKGSSDPGRYLPLAIHLLKTVGAQKRPAPERVTQEARQGVLFS
jgi:hypothetical protein